MTSRRYLLLRAAQLLDQLIMVGAFVMATVLVAFGDARVPLRAFLAMRLSIVNVALFLGLLLLWRQIFRSFGLYRSRRLASEGSEILDVLKAVSLGSIAILNAGFLFNIQVISPLFVVVFWAASAALTILSRLVLRTLQKNARRHGRNLNHVLIVGTNARAREFARKIRTKPELGYRIVGFVDEEWPGIQELNAKNEKLVAGFSSVRDYLRNNVVDEVVLAVPMSSCYREAAEIARLCEKQGVPVRLLSDFFNLDLAQAKVDSFDGQPVITLQTGRMDGSSLTIKRLVDITLSLVLLVALAPLLALAALLIKLTSSGPVFFVQERIGLNKRRFGLVKFRTMVADAETRLAEVEHLNEVSGPVFKIREDPRITPFGRFLRRVSIDELPQLINVLKGDMSLVGPRPLPVRDYQGFDEDWHRRRFSVRPGLTCLWQVSGRSAIPFERWMELDMLYIDEWSLWLDFKILARTVPAVLRGAGAA